MDPVLEEFLVLSRRVKLLKKLTPISSKKLYSAEF